MQSSLNLMNFKLNSDILQNKISRLNTLIPKSDKYDSSLQYSNTNTLGDSRKITNYSSTNNAYLTNETKSDSKSKIRHAKTINPQMFSADINQKISDTKDKINLLLHQSRKTLIDNSNMLKIR